MCAHKIEWIQPPTSCHRALRVRNQIWSKHLFYFWIIYHFRFNAARNTRTHRETKWAKERKWFNERTLFVKYRSSAKLKPFFIVIKVKHSVLYVRRTAFKLYVARNWVFYMSKFALYIHTVCKWEFVCDSVSFRYRFSTGKQIDWFQ